MIFVRSLVTVSFFIPLVLRTRSASNGLEILTDNVPKVTQLFFDTQPFRIYAFVGWGKKRATSIFVDVLSHKEQRMDVTDEASRTFLRRIIRRKVERTPYIHLSTCLFFFN